MTFSHILLHVSGIVGIVYVAIHLLHVIHRPKRNNRAQWERHRPRRDWRPADSNFFDWRSRR